MRRAITTLMFLLIAAAVAPATAEETTLDSVVRDVIKMLKAGVDEEIIVDWLDKAEMRPGSLSPDDLIALSEAEAPDPLVRRLVELSSAPAAEPGPAAAAAVVAPTPSAAPAAPATAYIPASATTGARSGGERVDFSVKYRPQTSSSESNYEKWDLYLYLDGKPLLWTTGRTTDFFLPTEVLEFQLPATPGPHVIRILQEKHTLLSKRKNKWSHEARVFPGTVEFDIAPGTRSVIDIVLDEKGPYFSAKKGPLSLRIEQGDAIVETAQTIGEPTSKWPALCEDLEVGMSEKKRESKSGQRALSECVGWASLWESVADAPGRDELRAAMEPSKYRPVPLSVK